MCSNLLRREGKKYSSSIRAKNVSSNSRDDSGVRLAMDCFSSSVDTPYLTLSRYPVHFSGTRVCVKYLKNCSRPVTPPWRVDVA